MRAATLKKFGSVDEFEIKKVSISEIDASQVLIKIEYVRIG